MTLLSRQHNFSALTGKQRARLSARFPRLAHRYRHLRAWWLRAMRRRLVTDVSFPLVACLVGSAVGYAVGIRPNLGSLILTEAFLFGVGYVLGLALANLAVGHMRSEVLDIAHAVTQGPNRAFLVELVDQELKQTNEMVRGLAGTDGYRPSPPEAMSSFFEGFFVGGNGRYLGIDRHVPSDYVRSFDWYLKIHAKHSAAGDIRVLIANKTQLTEDYLDAGKDWADFYQWHIDHGVELRWVDPDRADAIRRGLNVSVTDVGMWPAYAVLFRYDGDDPNPALSMVFPEDSPRNVYETIKNYATQITRASRVLDNAPPGIDVMNPELARGWDDYVDSSRRLDPTEPLPRWLLSTLKDRPHVLDAASGIGCESVLLLRHGFSVVSNEADATLRQMASDFATRHGSRLDLRPHAWELLREQLSGNPTFDAVIVLGNSLCLTLQEERRLTALQNFYDLLKPGGIIVIDERNFEYMLGNSDKLNQDPYQAFPPSHEGDLLYRGLRVRAYPTITDQGLVCWRFFSNEPPVASSNEMRSRRSLGKELQLHPFKRGEMCQLLRRAGFVDSIQIFADLTEVCELPSLASDPSQNPSSVVVDDSVRFITYVAERPASDGRASGASA